MKTIRLVLGIGLLVFSVVQKESLAAADPWTEAEAKFKEGLFQDALGKYEEILKTARGERRYQVIYRTIECEVMQFRTLQAADRLIRQKENKTEPTEWIWKMRFLLLRAEVFREASEQYAHVAPDEVESSSRDSSRKTAQEWKELIQQSFAELYLHRSQLLGVSVESESETIDTKDSDLEGIPTLWDFVVSRWSDFLLSRNDIRKSPKENIEDYLVENFSARWSTAQSPLRQAASLMEETSEMRGKERNLARERWKLKRLMLAQSYSSLFRSKNTSAQNQQENQKILVHLLKTLRSHFQEKEAHAEAGFEAASLLNTLGEYADAVSTCKEVEWDGLTIRGARKCRKLRADIELPRLDLTSRVAPPPGDSSIRFNVRNVPRLFFKIYKTNPRELLVHSHKTKYRQSQDQDWRELSSLQDDGLRAFLKKKAEAEFQMEIKPDKPYAWTAQNAAPPKLGTGLYVVIASNESGFPEGKSLVSGSILNITDLYLFGTGAVEADPEKFLPEPGNKQSTYNSLHLYVLDGQTGKPVPDAKVDAKISINYSKHERKQATTDSRGISDFQTSFHRNPRQSNQAWIDPLITHGDSYAYYQNGFGVYAQVPSPVEIYIETDRPIYRPGDRIRGKVTALKRISGGYQVFSGGGHIQLSIRDANSQEFFSQDLKLGTMGSAGFETTLPRGRLLGNYSVQAALLERNFSESFFGQGTFSVEEYKRPEFEVLLDEATSPWKSGHHVKITGKAKYYFGGAVPDAPVQYVITKRSYLPPFFRFWGWFIPHAEKTEVASGEIRTKPDGAFEIDFIPQKEEQKDEEPAEDQARIPTEYEVEVKARDTGGRTLEARKSFLAGAQAWYFDVQFQRNFHDAKKTVSVSIQMVDINGKPQNAKLGYEVFSIEEMKRSPGELVGLQEYFRNSENRNSAEKGTAESKTDTPAKLKLKPLQEGIYRLSLSAEDPWGGKTRQAVTFLVFQDGKSFRDKKLPSLMIAEHENMQVGETARLLVGTPDLTGTLFAEVRKGPFLLERKILDQGGIRVLNLPVTERHQQGFEVHWFGVSKFLERSGYTRIEVPRIDKDLKLKLIGKKAFKPGDNTDWILEARDSTGREVNGEATVRVFDRSLEYYMKITSPWALSLYPNSQGSSRSVFSVFDFAESSLPIREGWIEKIMAFFRERIEEKQLPGLKINRTRVYGSNGGSNLGYDSEVLEGGRGGRVMKKMMLESVSDMAMAPAPQALKSGAVDSGSAHQQTKQEAPVAIRSEFSDTAHFDPQLKVSAGKGAIHFKAPEQLSSWRILGQVITADVKRGTLSDEAVTKKDLMVRVEIPRFYREGDEASLKAVIHNETKAPLDGKLSLQILEETDTTETKPVHEEFGVRELEKLYSVLPGKLTAISFHMKIPAGTRRLKIRAIARSGELSDAEERRLPVMPSRQRLIENRIIALDGNVQKTLTLPGFQNEDPTRVNERLEFRVDPQLALSILNSIPFLVQYPWECTEQVINRYVPLAIVNRIYQKTPALAEAITKIPHRNTITPAWNKPDPLRLMELQESPWVQESQGRSSALPLIDMLNPGLVETQKQNAFSTLTERQLGDGGFPWFPGGRSDPYITLVVLDGLAQALRFGIEYPEQVVSLAMDYVFGEIPRHLQPETGQLSIILYAAYTLTSFPGLIPRDSDRMKIVKTWMEYSEKYASARTPIGKAYASWVYRRLGDEKKAQNLLDQALDGAKTDPLTGTYWAPEKMSWLWYNDDVEKHAFFLKTLLELRPKDTRISGMVQWLLFNRKGNEWKSTKASAAAIFSLLEVMKARGSLDKGDEYNIRWGTLKDQIKVAPFAWLAKPLSWAKQGEAIKPFIQPVEISKKGPGFAFASLSWIFSTEARVKADHNDLLELERSFFLRKRSGDDYQLQKITDGAAIRSGDEIEVQLKVNSKSQFEYMHLKDPKASGFESDALLSGWKWDQLSRYEEPRDSLTNFFMDWLPHGQYVLRYRVRPTLPGRYRIGAAQLQSMYAPEVSAHSDDFTIEVKE